MTLTTTVAVGLVAGLHGALYGAYKDSPHESFRTRRFVRELMFALAFAVGIFMFVPAAIHETAFIQYLSIFALTRIVTEFWKLFVRVEPQDTFRIPTQIHCVTGVVHHRLLRLLLGLGFVGSIYGVWALCTLIPDGTSMPVRGLLVGSAIGTAEAIAGAYKDGTIEGFHWFKFFKSPAFGAIGGIVAAGHTTSDAFLVLGAIGTMRMFLELLFKMLPRDYTPGKFPALVGRYTNWLEHRRHFIVPYALTWLLYLILGSHPEW
jgi:hypothetical protein